MSQRPIARSDDLIKLRNEGYDLFVVGGHLLIKNIPYVTAKNQVAYGTLIMRLNLADDKTNKPSDHVAMWSGEHPCHVGGAKIASIENASGPQDLGNGLRAD